MGTGWGTFTLKRTQSGGVGFTIQILAGTLPCQSCTLAAPGSRATASMGNKKITTRVEKNKELTRVYLADLVQLQEGDQLEIEIFG
jgi:non-lysosomal glucosylceramidase